MPSSLTTVILCQVSFLLKKKNRPPLQFEQSCPRSTIYNELLLCFFFVFFSLNSAIIWSRHARKHHCQRLRNSQVQQRSEPAAVLAILHSLSGSRDTWQAILYLVRLPSFRIKRNVSAEFFFFFFFQKGKHRCTISRNKKNTLFVENGPMNGFALYMYSMLSWD